MRSTVRLILVLFVVALIFNNYNSIKILNLTLDSLSHDLEQRTEMVVRELSGDLGRRIASLPEGNKELENALRLHLRAYSIRGIVLYSADYRPEITLFPNPPPELTDVLKNPRDIFRTNRSMRREAYLVVPGSFQDQEISRSMIVIFDIGRIIRIERSTKMITYLNFLLMAFAALLAFYLLESIWRPYRVLLQTAKAAPASLRSGETGNEADFLIATFNGVIARLKEKEQELARLHLAEKTRADEVQQLNQDLLRSISSGLILIDPSAKISVFNHAAEAILRIPASGVLNQPYAKVIGKISQAFKDDIDKCFSERKNRNRAELEIRTEDGDLRYLGASIMPLKDHQQAFAGVFCIFSDITEFKTLQQNMAQKEKFASLGEMAAGVAHGFRNSLGTIAGYLQLLENRISPDCSGYTTAIHKEFELLQKVVNDFLSFARPVQLQWTRVNLEELVRECCEEVRVASMPASIEVSVKGTFPGIAGDETALRQIIMNLLLNAAESTDGIGRQCKIVISGSVLPNSKHCLIEVRDNGAGIRAEDLSRIFTPFFSTKQKGVGLGLAIVQKLILQHNGSVSVESGSEGSLFRVQLPL